MLQPDVAMLQLLLAERAPACRAVRPRCRPAWRSARRSARRSLPPPPRCRPSPRVSPSAAVTAPSAKPARCHSGSIAVGRTRRCAIRSANVSRCWLLLRLHLAQHRRPCRSAQHRELAGVDAGRAIFAGMVDADHARHIGRRAPDRQAGAAALAHAVVSARGTGGWRGASGKPRAKSRFIAAIESGRPGIRKVGIVARLGRPRRHAAPGVRRSVPPVKRGAAHSGSGLGQQRNSTPTCTTASAAPASIDSTTSQSSRRATARRHHGRHQAERRSRRDRASAPAGRARRAPGPPSAPTPAPAERKAAASALSNARPRMRGSVMAAMCPASVSPRKRCRVRSTQPRLADIQREECRCAASSGAVPRRAT